MWREVGDRGKHGGARPWDPESPQILIFQPHRRPFGRRGDGAAGEPTQRFWTRRRNKKRWPENDHFPHFGLFTRARLAMSDFLSQMSCVALHRDIKSQNNQHNLNNTVHAVCSMSQSFPIYSRSPIISRAVKALLF